MNHWVQQRKQKAYYQLYDLDAEQNIVYLTDRIRYVLDDSERIVFDVPRNMTVSGVTFYCYVPPDKINWKFDSHLGLWYHDWPSSVPKKLIKGDSLIIRFR